MVSNESLVVVPSGTDRISPHRISISDYRPPAGVHLGLKRAKPEDDTAAPHISVATGDARVIVIGDVHGCFDELQQLLEECEYSQETGDVVILLGDLLRKGPDSAEVVQFARSQGFHSVLGNHDVAALEVYYQYWETGQLPIQDKMGSSEYARNLSKEDVSWLKSLPLTITLPDHNKTVLVHAGLVPGIPLMKQKNEHMYCMRNLERIQEDEVVRHIPLLTIDRGEPWAKLWQGVGVDWSLDGQVPEVDSEEVAEVPRFVIFGHDAPRQLQQYDWALGLDTNCCDGGRLTACILSPHVERTLKSVPALGRMVSLGDGGGKEWQPFAAPLQ